MKIIAMILCRRGICRPYRIAVGMIVTRTSVMIVTYITLYVYCVLLPQVPGVLGYHLFLTGQHRKMLPNVAAIMNMALTTTSAQRLQLTHFLDERSLINVMQKEILIRPKIGL